MKFLRNAFVNAEKTGRVFIIQFGQQEPNPADVWQRKVVMIGSNGRLNADTRISYKIIYLTK
jgi:hypothetical protein